MRRNCCSVRKHSNVVIPSMVLTGLHVTELQVLLKILTVDTHICNCMQLPIEWTAISPVSLTNSLAH